MYGRKGYATRGWMICNKYCLMKNRMTKYRTSSSSLTSHPFINSCKRMHSQKKDQIKNPLNNTMPEETTEILRIVWRIINKTFSFLISSPRLSFILIHMTKGLHCAVNEFTLCYLYSQLIVSFDPLLIRVLYVCLFHSHSKSISFNIRNSELANVRNVNTQFVVFGLFRSPIGASITNWIGS